MSKKCSLLAGPVWQFWILEVWVTSDMRGI